VNHILKTMVLSCAVMLFAMLPGCGDLSETGDVTDENEVSSASGSSCDSFCRNEGGPFYLSTFASSEAACSQRGGQWYTSDQGYEGPPPGCCCRCTRPGFCL
jgi:hypothetical protein